MFNFAASIKGGNPREKKNRQFSAERGHVPVPAAGARGCRLLPRRRRTLGAVVHRTTQTLAVLMLQLRA